MSMNCEEYTKIELGYEKAMGEKVVGMQVLGMEVVPQDYPLYNDL